MKKVMLGIIVIIPVIIVLVVAMVSVFVSMSAHIAVDDIQLDENYLEVEYNSAVSSYKLSDLLNVTITPDRASNKSYTWTIEDLVCIDDEYKEEWTAGLVPAPAFVSESADVSEDEIFEDVEEETCSQDGYLHINTYCSFLLKAQAETHIATCRVYVVGFKVESIVVKCSETTLTIGQNALIEAETYPVEAIVENWIYESSDDSIVEVDQNGVVNAVGAGTATIKVKASVYGENGKYVENTININVTDDVTLYGSSITTSSEKVLFAKLGVNASDVVIVDGATLNTNGDGIIITNNLAILEIKGKDVVISKCGDGDIVIDNANLFEAKEEGGYVLATESKLYLTSSFADDFKAGRPSVTWSSNRETIAKVDANGVVTGVSSGRAVITATTADGKSASVTINVQ